MDDLLFDCLDVERLCHFPSQEKRKKIQRGKSSKSFSLYIYISITGKKFQANYAIQLPMEHKNGEACI